MMSGHVDRIGRWIGFRRNFVSNEGAPRVRDHFEGLIRALGDVSVVGLDAPRLPTTSTICFHGLYSHKLVTGLNELGVCASGGAACHSGGALPSQTMLSLGMSREDAMSTVRFSFGPTNTVEEAEDAFKRLSQLLEQRESFLQ